MYGNRIIHLNRYIYLQFIALNPYIFHDDGFGLRVCMKKSVFKYSKGSDSVLVVAKDDYYNCKKDNPTGSLEDGDSVFKFNRSGPFFFISGYGDNCEKGQKLIIVVLAVWHRAHGAPQPTPLPTPTPAPWAAAHPQPPSQSPSPVVSPVPAAGSPQATSPTGLATEDAPGMGAPAPAPSSVAAVGDPVGFVVAVLGCFFFGLL